MERDLLSTKTQYHTTSHPFPVTQGVTRIKYNEKVEKVLGDDKIRKLLQNLNREDFFLEEYKDFSPAPIPSNENRRLEAVRKTGVMDVANEELFLI